MSVLYKALQKAEKENELRQSATSETGFDPQHLAASGALKFAGSRGQTLSRVVMSAVVLVAVGGGGAFLLFKDSLLGSASPAQSARPPVEVAAASVPSPVAPTAPAEASGPAPVSPASPADAPASVDPPSPTPDPQVATASPPTTLAAAPVPTPAPATPVPAERQVAAALPAAPTASKPAAPKPAARPAVQRPEPMPVIPADSPARMLSPPISVSRAEFELAGVGNQVQVRQIAETARNSASAGYDALMNGSYDTALGFYDAALKEEPNSVLALLGRATALQKLGRRQDAQAAYDQVLKLDPENREALTNLTAIVADRSPQEAITRLLELEHQYQTFSPIKAQIGLVYAKMGSMTQALDYLKRAVALSPETVMYHYNLALVLDHLGRKEQAVASYERVLASISGGRGPAELSSTEIERRVRFLRTR